MSAGIVNTTPPAIDSPADPIVWTMLFSRIVEPPSFLSTEIASTAIGIDALTVRPARRPRYTVDAPKSRPKSDPRKMARAVNSAGDCEALTYGWNAPRDGATGCCTLGCAIARDGSIEPCESAEQAETDARPSLRADHEPSLDLPPLPQRTGRYRSSDHLVTGTGGAIPSQRCSDSKGPRLLRRVRCSRRRLLRQGAAPTSSADPWAGPPASRRDCRCRKSWSRTGRLPWIPPGGFRNRGALRRRQREDRSRVARRRPHLRYQRVEAHRTS